MLQQVARMAGEGDVRGLMQLAATAPVMTLATVAPGPGDQPHATPVFFAMSSLHDCVALTFASDRSSTHGLHIGTGPTRVAAAAWAPTVESIADLRGFQALGHAHALTQLGLGIGAAARRDYFARFPHARDVFDRSSATLFLIVVHWAKLTDNARLGLGRHECLTFPPRLLSELDELESLVGARGKT